MASDSRIKAIVVDVVQKMGSVSSTSVLQDTAVHAFFTVLKRYLLGRLQLIWERSAGDKREYEKSLARFAAWDDTVSDVEIGNLEDEFSRRSIDIAERWSIAYMMHARDQMKKYPEAKSLRNKGSARVHIEPFENFFRRFVKHVCAQPSVLSGSIFSQSVVDQDILFREAFSVALSETVYIVGLVDKSGQEIETKTRDERRRHRRHRDSERSSRHHHHHHRSSGDDDDEDEEEEDDDDVFPHDSISQILPPPGMPASAVAAAAAAATSSESSRKVRDDRSVRSETSERSHRTERAESEKRRDRGRRLPGGSGDTGTVVSAAGSMMTTLSKARVIKEPKAVETLRITEKEFEDDKGSVRSHRSSVRDARSTTRDAKSSVRESRTAPPAKPAKAESIAPTVKAESVAPPASVVKSRHRTPSVESDSYTEDSRSESDDDRSRHHHRHHHRHH